MDGLLIVDKSGMPPLQLGKCVAAVTRNERGHSPYPSSHDVVQQVRRLSRQRRIGHTGTLDPMASGVLVLCLGWATRLVEYYQGHDKRYRAEITFGCETDTNDALATVTRTAPAPNLSVESVKSALDPFRGEILQVPPVYSALKQEGESVHYKARRGEEVTVEARAVTIYELELIAVESPRVTLSVDCSAGTYIRSLARDLGRALGSAATLTALRRESAGAFTLANAHTLDEIQVAVGTESLTELLLPPGAGLDLPSLTVDPAVAQRLGNGQRVHMHDYAQTGIAQARDEAGRLLGIVDLRPSADGIVAKADKWFAAPEHATQTIAENR